MSTNRIVLRIATLLFLLAGLLLLRKPVFGQPAEPLPAKPANQTISRHFIMYDQPAAFDKAVQTFLRP